MTATARTAPPKWFWIAAAAAVVWTLIGVASYIMDVTMGADAYASMPEAQRALYETRPVWITGVYAVAVFSALGGAVALALRKGLAAALFALSLAAIVIQFGYVFFVMGALAVVGAAGAVFPIVIILAGAAMLWLSRHAKAKGWLG